MKIPKITPNGIALLKLTKTHRWFKNTVLLVVADNEIQASDVRKLHFESKRKPSIVIDLNRKEKDIAYLINQYTSMIHES